MQTMFEKTFSFLRQIKENNNREWYHANKSTYQDAKQEFEHFIELLIHESTNFDASLKGLTPKDCIFRIFRDVRFSKDKSPYKTNFGAFLVPGGRKSMHAGYYLHLEPGSSFIASGIYMPPSNILRAIRNDIFEHYEEYKSIINSSAIRSTFQEMGGEKLKSAPRGFPKDFEGIEDLKYKSYGLMNNQTDAEIMAPDSLETILNTFETAKPFVRFMNEAVEKAEK